jgi:hypothetical protein
MTRAWAELHVLSENQQVAATRQRAAESVLRFFEDHYSLCHNPKVVCILDDQDGWDLKREIGPENRGLHCPPRGYIYRCLPYYVRPLIGPVDSRTNRVHWPFDMVIYLHGSTCESEIGLSLCLAHELQHFIQYAQHRSFWALNALLVELHSPSFRFWWDFPTEREARIIAKRVGVELFGEDAIDSHIERQILAHVTDTDAADWEFVRSLDSSVPYDLAGATTQLVVEHRRELTAVFERFREDEAFAGLDLEGLVRGEQAD